MPSNNILVLLSVAALVSATGACKQTKPPPEGGAGGTATITTTTTTTTTTSSTATTTTDEGGGGSGGGQGGSGGGAAGCVDGAFPCTVTVIMDECGHDPFIGLGPSETCGITYSGPSVFIDITGLGEASGDHDPDTCEFTATGVATVAGNPNTTFEWAGKTSLSFEATLAVGTLGNLPGGCPIIYAVTAQ